MEVRCDVTAHTQINESTAVDSNHFAILGSHVLCLLLELGKTCKWVVCLSVITLISWYCDVILCSPNKRLEYQGVQGKENNNRFFFDLLWYQVLTNMHWRCNQSVLTTSLVVATTLRRLSHSFSGYWIHSRRQWLMVKTFSIFPTKYLEISINICWTYFSLFM